MTQEGFYMSSRQALVFFRTCKMFGINSYEDRMTLVRKMVARKKVRYLRDGQEFLQGKRIIGFKPKEGP